MDFEELLLIAAQIGIRPNEFWEMTYAEFSIMVEANNEKQKYEMQKLVMQSWYTAVWQRTKTVPKLEDIIEDLNDSTEEATDDKIMRKMNKLRKRGGVN